MKYEMIILLFDEHAYERMLNDLNASLFFVLFAHFLSASLHYRRVYIAVQVNIQRMCKSLLDNCFWW